MIIPDRRQNAGLLGNEGAIVETCGGSKQVFLFELDGGRSPFRKTLTPMQ